MKLCYTPRAIADLEAIADHLKPLTPRGAQNVRQAILETLQNLIDFPRIGRPQTINGVRKLGTRKYPYLVFYTADETAEEIIILSIQHTSRESEFADL